MADLPLIHDDFAAQLPPNDDLPLPPASPPPPGTNIHDSPTEALPRLAIHSLQLNNFKSYGGTVRVGPFHKNFSAIVGPNGSGKSNVIDAMLFVFGRPAKHLRHSKLSELLHNSATYPKVQSATVTVFFHDIIDTGDNDNDFTVLPNSEFSVARTAYRNNTSKYFINKTEVKRKEVVELLKGKGVDLDNNRFLILQGEVEQIAMMKPKSVNAHDTGLLEYLEDIIGSNRHIEKIEQTCAAVESLQEERGHKLQRVKAAEQERDGLESAKQEAEDYLDKERDMLNKKITLNKSKQCDGKQALQNHKEAYEQAKSKVDNFKSDVREKEATVSELEKTFNEVKRKESDAVKQLNEAKESFAAYERKDIKLREDSKALKASIKKLKTTINREQERADENEKKIKEFEEEQENAKKEKAEAETNLQEAQKDFDKIRDEVKQTTQPIRQQLEKKQEELMPFSKGINDARRDVQVNQSTIAMLTEKLAAPQKDLDDANQSVEAIRSSLENANEKSAAIKNENEEHIQKLTDMDKEIATRRTQLQEMSTECSSMRRRIEEARSAREFSTTRSKLHNAVLSASRQGLLHGVIGRLGDLASVNERYATSVSAAAGASLDCIVVQTAENAQECIQFLRAEHLGRATFIILEKVEYLRSSIESWSRSDRSQDGSRLYDFLNIPKFENQTAVYYTLRDTLVAESLEDARRMAFKPTRQNRVVTLTGELIESSGAMTGGGRGPTRYRLGSGRGSEGEMDEASYRKLCSSMEALRGSIQEEHHAIDQLEESKRESISNVEKLGMELSKCHAEISSLESRLRNMIEDTIPSLKKAIDERTYKIHEGTCEHTNRLKDTEKKLRKSEKELENAKVACKDIESEIARLQEEILSTGGSKLDSKKEELEQFRKEMSKLQSNISTTASRTSAAKKAMKKAEKNVENAEKELVKAQEEFDKKKAESEAMLDDAEKVSSKIGEAEEVHKKRADKLEEVQAEYSEVKGALKSLRRKEVSLVETADSLNRLALRDAHFLKTLRKDEKSLLGKLKKLALTGISVSSVADEEEEQQESEAENMDVDEEDSGAAEVEGDDDVTKNQEEAAEAMVDDESLSAQEKKRLETEIAALESELANMSPNLGAIAEYTSKDREYTGQVGELDDVTKRRDEARKECESLRKARLDEFMNGFSIITLKLKELYQMITLGGDAELELVDSLDPFSEGIVFSVRPPKKSWKNICNLSGGEKTLSSLALVFALHHFKPTPLYFLDEIDAALDFKNVSIVGNYVKERTKDAQFIIISLRNNMFELADRLVGIYKTHHTTKSVTINPHAFVMPTVETTQVTTESRLQ